MQTDIHILCRTAFIVFNLVRWQQPANQQRARERAGTTPNAANEGKLSSTACLRCDAFQLIVDVDRNRLPQSIFVPHSAQTHIATQSIHIATICCAAVVVDRKFKYSLNCAHCELLVLLSV